MYLDTRKLISAISEGLDRIEAGADGDKEHILHGIRAALAEVSIQLDGSFKKEFEDNAHQLLSEGRDILVGEGGQAMLDLLPTSDASVEAKLSSVVRALAEIKGGSPVIEAFLSRVVDWENALYKRRQSVTPGASRESKQNKFNKSDLQEFLKEKGVSASVTDVVTLSGGFSKETVLFDTVGEQKKEESYVIRAEQRFSLLFLPGSKVANEFDALMFAYEKGVPVAEPLALEVDETIFGVPFILSRKGRGKNIGSRVKVGEGLSEELLHDFLAKLVDIHSIDIASSTESLRTTYLGKQLHQTRSDAISAQIAMWEEGIQKRNIGASPILQRTLGWLKTHIPEEATKPCLLHGDYGLHNVLVEGDKVTCILDWESAQIGHPAEDLAWLLDGLSPNAEREKIISIYEEISGAPVSAFAVRYFEVFNVLKFSTVCPSAASLFEDHEEIGVEACQLALFYQYFGTMRLNDAIAAAERCLPSGQQTAS